MSDFILLGSEINEDDDCRHEIKRHLLLGRIAMTNLDSVLKSETWLCNKGPYRQSYCFSGSHVQMWKVDQKESGVPKYWCFQTVALEKTLASPLVCNQSILKEISPEYTLEGQMLKLKFEYFGHLIGKDPDAGKDWRQEEKGMTEDEMASPTQWIWVWANSRG